MSLQTIVETNKKHPFHRMILFILL